MERDLLLGGGLTLCMFKLAAVNAALWKEANAASERANLQNQAASCKGNVGVVPRFESRCATDWQVCMMQRNNKL